MTTTEMFHLLELRGVCGIVLLILIPLCWKSCYYELV